MNSLNEHEGFKYLMEIGKNQVVSRQYSLLKPLDNMDETLRQEFEKGEIQGILTMVEMNEQTIELIDSLIKDKHHEDEHVSKVE